jgi:hypothetical protein
LIIAASDSDGNAPLFQDPALLQNLSWDLRLGVVEQADWITSQTAQQVCQEVKIQNKI